MKKRRKAAQGAIFWVSLAVLAGVASAAAAPLPERVGAKKQIAAAATSLPGRLVPAAGLAAPAAGAPQPVLQALIDRPAQPGVDNAKAESPLWEFVKKALVVAVGILVVLLMGAGVLVGVALFQDGVQQRKLEDQTREAMLSTASFGSAAQQQIFYLKQIAVYQNETRGRARSSFSAALVAMFLGMGFMVWGALAMAKPWAGSAIGALGGALSAFITKTFLDVHKVSLVQLNRYFRQPVLQSNVIEARLLADEMGSDDLTRRAYSKIITSVIRLIQDESLAPDVQLASAKTRSKGTGDKSKGRSGKRNKESTPGAST